MREIRPLTDAELERFAAIAADAYPGMHVVSPDDHQRLLTRMRSLAEDPTITWVGLFRDGALLGGMRLHDFTMNLLGVTAPAGGVGMVAVDLLHKKEHIARDLITWFLEHYREAGAPLALLYPFRPDFYAQMGFGHGPKWSRYHVLPASLPSHGDRSRVALLGPADLDAVRDCYARFMARTHGMIAKPDRVFAQMLANPERRVFGYRDGEEGGMIRGYCVCAFVPGAPENFISNDLRIGELIYESPAALTGLLSLLHAQADQIRAIILDTPDANFHYLLGDPRNGSEHMLWPIYHESNTQGVGLMYRVTDIPRLFTVLRDRDFGGQTLTLRLHIRDSFMPANDGAATIAFRDGHPELLPADAPANVELALDIATFSSLVVGAVDFRTLHRLGLATLSRSGLPDDSDLDKIHALFRVDAPPICTVEF